MDFFIAVETKAGSARKTLTGACMQATEINKEYGRLRKKCISLEMEDKLVMMFSNIVATGGHAWAPSSGVLPPETREESIGQIDSNDEEESETIQYLRQATRKRKKEQLTKENCKRRRLIRKGKKLEVLQNFVVKLTVLLKFMKLGVLQTH
ncbi:uncharacterized protein LOC126625019 isoform X1 [Malus sylvestris]|uniref:uncharacterized protein LOC126625019 isoform X1 n=1 Tax=Malus sylvestris TaxID=3752 RepID=UPI0021AC41D7|nr:uncharacterized protein LOC126625019 isoform X1 [Malus sylvestris]